MSDEREQTNEGIPAMPFEKMEEALKSVVPDAKKAAMDNILDEYKEAFAAAELRDELTAEELEAEARDRASFKLQRKCRRARIIFKVGIEIKRNEPDSELYKLAKEGLELVDQIEGDNLDALPRYETVLFLYMQNLRGVSEKQKDAEKREPTTSQGAVSIDLNEFSESGSYRLLHALLADKQRKGVALDEEKYGKKQPKELKDILRGHDLGNVGKRIIRVDATTIKLDIPAERIALIPKKEKK
jgi:hypothetical protein